MLKGRKKYESIMYFFGIIIRRNLRNLKSTLILNNQIWWSFSIICHRQMCDCAHHIWKVFCLCQVIRNHPSALEIYQRKLLESGKISKVDIDKLNKKVSTILNEEFQNSKDYVPNKRDWLSAYWTGFKSPEQISRIRNTG
jgi:hypothetical protein